MIDPFKNNAFAGSERVTVDGSLTIQTVTSRRTFLFVGIVYSYCIGPVIFLQIPIKCNNVHDAIISH